MRPLTPLRARPPRSALLAGAAGLLALAALTTSCSGPNGVTLGTDWKGSEDFTLSRIGGQLAVVGINPEKHRAEPLTVVPAQGDDDDTLAPQIAHLANGKWLLAVGRKGGKPDRLYVLDAKNRAVGRQAAVEEAAHGIVASAHYLAGVPGQADSGDGGHSSVLVGDGADLRRTVRTVRVDGTVSQAAGGTDSDKLCVTQDEGKGRSRRTRVLSLDLATGRTDRVIPFTGGTQAQTVACRGGRPVVGTPAAGRSGVVSMERRHDMDVVRAVGGRVDQLAVDGGTVAAAVFHGGKEILVTFDTATGHRTAQVTLPGLTDAAQVVRTRAGWLVVSPQDGAAVVRDGAAGSAGPDDVRHISLPGQFLAAS
ncbi:hypothetical protein [Streptomyces sp. NBC_00388]|uniref:hypothetical protein n=1 Tax=Streptomyces sp. NBC_00388 TaxID=2975735 RepID=UPI002E24AC61